MATVNIRTSKRGTTIRLKAGKSEDLRGFVEAMLGQGEKVDAPATDHPHTEYPADIGIAGNGEVQP